MSNSKFLVIFLLAGCGERFASSVDSVDGGFDQADTEIDGRGDSGSGGSDAGGAPTVMDGSGVYEAGGGDSDGALEAGGDSSAGGALDAGGGSGGAPEAGGASSSGGAPEAGRPAPGLPPCCVDADCPSEIPYCTPWGTCGPGGDPYSCNYDFHCESYCYHCIGMQGGTCNTEKSCDCN